MPEEVVQTPPQQQPGPSRTADGTIIDQSTQTTEAVKTDANQTQQTTSTDKDSSATDKTGDKTPKDGEPVLTGAPEKYVDFKLPDGFTADKEMMGAAGELFKKMNISQDGAQQLVDLYAKNLQAAQEAPFKAYIDMKQGWTDAVTAKYGKDIEEGGKHYVAVGSLLEKLGPAEMPFREAMDVTGVGSHPAFVDAFIEFAKMLGSGTHVKGNGPSPLGQSPGATPQRSLAQSMYPHLPSSAG